MKRAKKLLALLLTLVLAFALAAPAFAEEPEPTVNWDAFYIVEQPKARQLLKEGETVTLSVKVNIPEGVTVEYKWYQDDYLAVPPKAIEGATGSTLQLSFDDSDSTWKNYPGCGFCCVITGYEKEGEQIISQKELQSDTARVLVNKTVREYLWEEPINNMVFVFLWTPYLPFLGPLFGIGLFFENLYRMIRVAIEY